MIFVVRITKSAQKDLASVPANIAMGLAKWAKNVELRGLEEVRKIPGYHDEPLRGDRRGQRSIRLSRAYRAIYVVKADETIEFVSVEEVNKHEY